LDPTLDSGRLDPTQTTRAALVTDEIRFSWIAMRDSPLCIGVARRSHFWRMPVMIAARLDAQTGAA
jgi:hypothetical protein